MKKYEEKVLASQKVFAGRMINVRIDKVELPNHKQNTREVVEHPGAVAIVPVLDDGRIILVKQYRHAVTEYLLEIPAGKLEQGESPDDSAARELEEETGYKAGNLRKLAAVYTTPGFTNEVIHLYLATGLVKSKQNLDADEFIDIETLSPETLKGMITAGEIKDAKTALGLLMAGI